MRMVTMLMKMKIVKMTMVMLMKTMMTRTALGELGPVAMPASLTSVIGD